VDGAKRWFLPQSQASARCLSPASAAIVLGALSAVNSFPWTCLQAALAKQPTDWLWRHYQAYAGYVDGGNSCNSVTSHARRSL